MNRKCLKITRIPSQKSILELKTLTTDDEEKEDAGYHVELTLEETYGIKKGLVNARCSGTLIPARKRQTGSLCELETIWLHSKTLFSFFFF